MIAEANEEEDGPHSNDPEIDDDGVPEEPAANGEHHPSREGLGANIWSPGDPQDESGTSGSDYSKHRDAQLLKRSQNAARGQTVTNTEEEDAEMDEEHRREADAELPNESPRKDKTQHGRGKQPAHSRAAYTDENVDETHGAEEGGGSDGDVKGDWQKVPGPLPQAAYTEAQELAALIKSEAEKIARKYKKSTRQVMHAAGLGIRAARARNTYNMFKKWYAHHHPNTDSTWTVLILISI
jgi:hypothetical protein